MQGKRALRRPLNRRRPLLHGSRSLSARQDVPHTVNVPVLPQPEVFDPDMLYVECGHCGAPLGKSTTPTVLKMMWMSSRMEMFFT